MELQIDILRRDNTAGGKSAPYWQRFSYESQHEGETVATALTRLNEREELRDVDGNPSARIRWECGCLQRKCGACAMVINGRPGLACDARLSDFPNGLRLEPLRKFPCVADLVVDRSVMFDNLRELRVWLEQQSEPNDRNVGVAYEASRCLQCGCCLEVCPNFSIDGRFTGMAAGVPMTRLLSQISGGQRRVIAKAYRERVFEGCGKSLACRNICPAGIDIEHILVNSNAIAVMGMIWKSKRRSME